MHRDPQHILDIIESARRVSQQFRQEHPQIPWSEMIGMRNRMIHDYDDVDLDIVWETAQRAVPQLLAMIEPLAPPEEA
jgi:uncharacterized protein with HEPN domain